MQFTPECFSNERKSVLISVSVVRLYTPSRYRPVCMEWASRELWSPPQQAAGVVLLSWVPSPPENMLRCQACVLVDLFDVITCTRSHVSTHRHAWWLEWINKMFSWDAVEIISSWKWNLVCWVSQLSSCSRLRGKGQWNSSSPNAFSAREDVDTGQGQVTCEAGRTSWERAR